MNMNKNQCKRIFANENIPDNKCDNNHLHYTQKERETNETKRKANKERRNEQ